jgi:two-component system response regulator
MSADMETSTLAAAEPTPILVAEDNKYDRMILQQAFNELGLNVGLYFVDNGEELLDYLYRRNAFATPIPPPRPALVLMDLNMPRMNGHEATRAIRQDEALRLLPVIVFSTSGAPAQVTQAYANGVNAFMTKPGPYDDFLDLIRKFGSFWLTAAKLPVVHAGTGEHEGGGPCVSF